MAGRPSVVTRFSEETPLRRRSREFLLRSIHPSAQGIDSTDAGQIDLGYVFERARAHKVGPLCANRLLTLQTLPPTVRVSAEAELEVGRLRSRKSAFTCSAVSRVLERAGVRFAVLKGPAVATYYPRPELRPYSDLDVLVEPRSLRRASEALESLGYQSAAKPPATHSFDFLPQSHALTSVDLHIRLRSAREVGVETSELLEGFVVEGSLGGLRVPVLTPAANLLHVLLHAVSVGPFGFYLLHLADAAWIIDRDPRIDPTEVESIAVQWGVERLFGLSHSLLRRYFGFGLSGASPRKRSLVFDATSSPRVLIDQELFARRRFSFPQELLLHSAWDFSFKRPSKRAAELAKRQLDHFLRAR